MGCTAQDILKIACAEIGTTEKPANSNNVKYNTEYYGKEVSGSKYPWCCSFQWDLFKEAGASELFYGGKKTASCSTLYSYHKKKGQAITSNYQPGDMIFFNFSGKKTIQHVGICESYDKIKGTITTIDGNTGTTNEANGGAVMRRTRKISTVVAAYRPKYTVIKERKTYSVDLPLLQKGDEGEDVKSLQVLLTGRKCSTAGFDGKFGTNTDKALRKFQKENNLTVDGKCGPSTWKALLGV